MGPRTNTSGLYRALDRLIGSKNFLLYCLLAALVLRVAWILAVHNRQISDFGLYLNWGRDIAEGRGFMRGARASGWYPVGYPAFLASLFYVFGFSPLVAKLANIALYLGIIYFTFKLAIEVFHSRLVAGVSAMALAIYPNHIAYSSVLLSETLFTFLVMMAAWLIARSSCRLGLIVVGGFVFGVANMVRPLAGLLMLAIFLCLFAAGRRPLALRAWAAAGCLLLIGFCAGLSPYVIRNYVVLHRFAMVSQNGGVNLLMGNNPYANGTYPNDHAVLSKVLALVAVTPDEFETNARYTRYAKQYMMTHVARTLALWPRKVFYLYAFEVDGINRNLAGLAPGSKLRYLAVITQGYYMLAMLGFLAAICVFLARRKAGIPGQRLPTVGLWVLVVWTAIHVVTLGSSRYHYPMAPWIVMYASAMVSYVLTGAFTGDGNNSA